MGNQFRYLNREGDFELTNPETISYLYFPLANESGVMSSITPDLGGDSKMSQNTFLMPPVSSENLHNDKSSRNIWCLVDGKPVSLTGRSGEKQAELFSEEKDPTKLTAGFMHQTVDRELKKEKLFCRMQSVVPSSGETFELLKVTLENTGKDARKIQLAPAIPIYGRSAANIRDHRHVTSLLHRIHTVSTGVIVDPTMTFDERGHKRNTMLYGVFGAQDGEKPAGFYPTVQDFIQEGGNLENPGALYQHTEPLSAGTEIDGYEALGGLIFQEKVLQPGEKTELVLAMGYGKEGEDFEGDAGKLLTAEAFDEKWTETAAYWKNQVNVSFHTGSEDFDRWMKWVSFQPFLRRIYGCSFLPHHDYGKGGRGWRDLWQDCLALLKMNPSGVRQMLIDNFGGVRLDGTNATIIGDHQGEFIADRNGIARVWMDHGMWPFLTVELYLEETGDLEILLEKNGYFKDQLVSRGEERDDAWEPEQGSLQLDSAGNPVDSTLLEHILIENVSSFYDVGEHNEIRLRGADWNDALDMAADKGESVAFTTMYAYNLAHLADYLEELDKRGIHETELTREMRGLFTGDTSLYEDPAAKRKRLMEYCESVRHTVSGEKEKVSLKILAADLRQKAEWMKQHIRRTEWISTEDGESFFNGYYDNSGRRVEGDHENGVRMMLTSQVFSIMSGTADPVQTKKIIQAADRYLYDEKVGGYRLNTNFHEIKMDLGRMFGFAYGQKENGAVFCHMTTMYGNALYRAGEYEAAFKAFETLYRHCQDIEKSRIYPGVPEYIDDRGRGMYHYLTGAASWMLVTVMDEMFGISGHLGNLRIHPGLLARQFDDQGKAGMQFVFAGKKLKVIVENPEKLEPDQYQVTGIQVDGKALAKDSKAGEIPAEVLSELSDDREHEILVNLGPVSED